MTIPPDSSSAAGAGFRNGQLISAAESNDEIHILVADDDETSTLIITRSLQKAGYRVSRARDGNEAWRLLCDDQPPHIALLDWVMPGYSGPEICSMLAARTDVFVYTVLITSRSDPRDMVEGLQAGANEFLIKPVNLAEFNARINAAVRLLRYERDLARKQAELAEYATRMESLAEARAHQLVHADRIATLGVMSAGIIHEIKNPLTYLIGNSQTLERYWATVEPLLLQAAKMDSQDAERLDRILTNTPRLLEGIRSGVGHINRIVSGLSRFSHGGKGGKTPVALRACVDAAVDLSHACWKYHATVTVTGGEDLPMLVVDEQEIVQVLVNLIVNASDALENRTDGKDSRIAVVLRADRETQQVQVIDNGPGIPEAMIADIWNPFFTTKEQGKGTGLGLSISQGIIHAHNGSLTVENLSSGGACFTITLPAEKATAGVH